MGNIVIIVSSNSEWKVLLDTVKPDELEESIYGNWFIKASLENTGKHQVIWFHGSWGKIASAGSTQYAIDKWHPELIINIGSCGGFEGFVENDEIVLVEETIVYDLIDRIGESGKSIIDYRTTMAVDWVTNEQIGHCKRVKIATADQDLDPERLVELNSKYGAVVGDWESGAIAWIAERNKTRLVILRGVSDVVGENGNIAYNEDETLFFNGVKRVMEKLILLVNDLVRTIS